MFGQNTAANPEVPPPPTCPRPHPAIAFGVPDAFAKGYLGMSSFGGTLQSRTRLSGDVFDPDGNISAGLGLGDPERWLGVELRTNVYGLSNDRGAGDNFGEGTIDIHLSRKLGGGLWLGGGIFNLTGWKRQDVNELYSGYFTATKVMTLRDSGFLHKIYLTIGTGNGRFRSDEIYDVDTENGLGIFGSLAVPVFPRANFIMEWKGYEVVSGFSFFPFKNFPAQMVIGMNDIFHQNRSFILAGSLSISLFQPKNKTCWKQKGWQGPPPPQASRI